MPRRVALPGAQELFRTTEPAFDTGPRPSGRVKHDEKITVYVSSDELLALERLRLQLRAEHGIATDRGRIVRAALASALEQVREQGADADVVRRLTAT